MGDVSTHAQITEFVVAEARRTIGDVAVPPEEYTYLELGNFLTDVSQFRDPTAFHRARGVALARAQELSYGTAGIGDVGGWADDVFGRAREPRHGALPEMLRLLVQGFVHLLFDTDGLPAIAGALDLAAPGRRPAILPAHGIPPADVTRALAAHFTQYYPHEHLDFPPTRAALATHRTDPLFAAGPRGLVAYLEADIDYLSEALSQLELEWVTARAAGVSAAQRQGFLVRLGHLLHPVEDYFFHSNLLEQHQWSLVRAAHPRLDPDTPADLRALVDGALAETRLDPSSVALRRKLARRLRYPVWDGESRLSRTTSDTSIGLVYTGGFGQTDVWHTLGGALEAAESTLDRLPASHDPRRGPLVLFRLLLSRAERREMVARGLLEQHQVAHREQLRSGAFEGAIARWESFGLCPHAAARLREAFAQDLAVAEKHKGWVYDFPGPGGVLLVMLDQMQRERDASGAAKSLLDRSPTTAYAVESDNMCSEENVGTHSLMSKDAEDKEPMRPEAVALAKHASAAIATTLLARVHSGRPVGEGVDWDAVLRFFLRGPSPTPGAWESELVAQVRAPGAYVQPSVDAVRDQPPAALLGPGREPQRLARRRAGTKQRDLEAYYRSFESNA